MSQNSEVGPTFVVYPCRLRIRHGPVQYDALLGSKGEEKVKVKPIEGREDPNGEQRNKYESKVNSNIICIQSLSL